MKNELIDLAEILQNLPFRNHNVPVHLRNALIAQDEESICSSLREVCQGISDMGVFYTEEDCDKAVDEARGSHDEEIEVLEDKIQDLKDTRADLEGELDDLNSRLDEARGERDDFEREVAQLQERVVSLEDELSELRRSGSEDSIWKDINL